MAPEDYMRNVSNTKSGWWFAFGIFFDSLNYI